jgi:hypothetical protein
MIVAVVGSRTFTDFEQLFADLDEIRQAIREDFGTGAEVTIISGGARGADQFAEAWAQAREVPFRRYLPNYQEHGGVRGRAEMIRNREMVEAAHCLVAYWDHLSRGTAATIEMAKKRGIPVLVLPFGPAAPARPVGPGARPRRFPLL